MKKTSRSRLAKAFVALADKSNFKQLLAELASELVSSHRMAEADLLVKDIRHELLHQKQQLEAEVYTAHKLGPEVLTEIERRLIRYTRAKRVNLQVHLVPALLGGIRVETPDEQIDLSLKFKLEQLEA